MMQFHLVLGEKDCLHQPIETVVEQAIQGGVTHIQLREKTASTRHFLAVYNHFKTGCPPNTRALGTLRNSPAVKSPCYRYWRNPRGQYQRGTCHTC
ncbi:MAG: hypothetical protein EBX40_01865 [Gammaproteobacteria bacterium]|nr:hypothetical protein [Gammaproteobacteria bacterium]